MGDPRNHGPTSSRFLYVFFQYHWANSSRWQRMPRPRWALRLEAFAWRNLMDLGMFLHRLHSPRPLSPSFRRSIPVTVSPRKGTINLLFYTPRDYPQRHSDNVSSRYPVLANFHGGGYTIGMAFTVPLRLQSEICRRMERSNEGQLATYLPRSDVRLAVIMSWYPTTDFATNTRVERRKTNIRPDKELPKFFTQLFDASYLYPPHS